MPREPIISDYFYGDEAEQFSYFRIPRLLLTNPRFKVLSTDAKLLFVAASSISLIFAEWRKLAHSAASPLPTEAASLCFGVSPVFPARPHELIRKERLA